MALTCPDIVSSGCPDTKLIPKKGRGPTSVQQAGVGLSTGRAKLLSKGTSVADWSPRDDLNRFLATVHPQQYMRDS
jgi:hypothetical protein